MLDPVRDDLETPFFTSLTQTTLHTRSGLTLAQRNGQNTQTWTKHPQLGAMYISTRGFSIGIAYDGSTVLRVHGDGTPQPCNGTERDVTELREVVGTRSAPQSRRQARAPEVLHDITTHLRAVSGSRNRTLDYEIRVAGDPGL